MEFVDLLVILGSALSLGYLLMAILADPPALDVANRAADPAARAAEAMREIEQDFLAGKMSQEDYETVKDQTVAELAAGLKEGKKPHP